MLEIISMGLFLILMFLFMFTLFAFNKGLRMSLNKSMTLNIWAIWSGTVLFSLENSATF